MKQRWGVACVVAVLAAAGCDGEDACERAARRIDSDCSGDPYGDAFATTRAQFVTSCRVGDAECGQCVEDVLGAAAGGSCVDRLEACRSACASTTADGGIDTDARALEDAGPGADAGGGDSGSDGAVDTCDTSTPGVGLGSACSAGMCGEPWECQAEMAAVEIPTTTPTGEPGPALIATIYPDGLCSTTCLLDDPGEVCGECGRCDGIRLGRIFLITGVDPAGNALGVCRASCLPSRTDNGGCREGYTCDVNNGTCVEACESDMQCQFGSGDGGQIVFIGAESGARCDPATARCTVSGDDGARPGDACTRDTDCEDDGFCITGDEWPGGYCSRAGCLFDGFECAEGAACDVRSFGSVSVCLDGCRVGAEPLADVLGADGNGAGCAEGFMCSWDGRSGPSSDPNGGCQPGAYNDVTTPNLAQPCQSDADCYSPYGYARCLFEDSTDVISGMCSLRSCAQFDEGGAIVSGILPGVSPSVPFCDLEAGELCVNFGTPEVPETLCLKSCASAAECAPGYACLEFFSDGTRVCWPSCAESSDCRVGQQCRDAGMAPCADGTSMECHCTPACLSDADCAGAGPGLQQCVRGTCRACDPTDDAGCSAGSTAPQCHQSTFTCVACDALDDAGCGGATPQCDPSTNTCVP